MKIEVIDDSERTGWVAAIGDEGGRSVVCGLGRTEKEAEEDAAKWDPDWKDEGHCFVQVPSKIVKLIDCGVIWPKELGIRVKRRKGVISSAEYDPLDLN